jgi:Overcoming lysogenization defect protein-like, TOPRIM domain
VCNHELWSIKVTREEIEGLVVDWVMVSNHRPVGLVGYEEVPRGLLQIIKTASLETIPNDIKVILFPTKSTSNDFMMRISKQEAERYLSHELELPSEESRYMLLRDEVGRRFFLVNMSKVMTDSLPFLVQIVPRTFERLAQIAPLPGEALTAAAAKVVWDYNKKFVIPFMIGSKRIDSFIRILSENLKSQYAEYLSLKESISNENLSPAKDFLYYKLQLLAEAIKNRRADSFLDVVEALGKYAQMEAIVSSTSDWPGLHKSLEQTFAKLDQEIQLSYAAHRDIQLAFGIIKSDLSAAGFEKGYEGFMTTLGKTIEKAFAQLRPQYVWLDGILSLMKVGGKYSEQWLRTGDAYVPGFGTFDEFLSMSFRVYRKKNVYQEVPLMAGQIIFSLLNSKLMYDYDEATLKKSATLVRSFTARLEHELGIVKRKNPKTALRYDDSALNLISVAKMAQMHGELRMSRSLRKLADAQIERHRLLSIELMLSWTDYLNTFDSTFLKTINRHYDAIESSKPLHGTTHVKVAANVVQAIFDEGNATEFLARAEEYAQRIALDLPTDEMGYGADLPVVTVASAQITMHMVNIFRNLIAAVNSKDGTTKLQFVRQANAEAKAMGPLCHPEDPVTNLVLRTEALNCLLTRDYDQYKVLMQRLRLRAARAAQTIRLPHPIHNWQFSNEGLVGGYLSISRLPVDSLDLWDQAAKGYFATEMSDEIAKSILGSKAIVFVEGESDVLVFREFSRKLLPETRLGFLDTRGWTNMKYYPEADIAREAGMPMFCIFDGDTDNLKELAITKKKLLKELTLPTNHVKTLKRNSIEDYLLVPAAIARAFPKVAMDSNAIQDYLQKNSAKRNKKGVLASLLNNMNLGGYDKHVAKEIASAMLVSEISQEISKVLRNISALR